MHDYAYVKFGSKRYISIFTDAPLDLIEKVKSEMNYQEPKENYHYERNKA